MSDRRKRTPRQKSIVTGPFATLPASPDKLVACLSYENDADLWQEYGEAAPYVKQLAEIKWNEKNQWNMGVDAADSHRKGEYLVQLIFRKYPEAASKLGISVTPKPQLLTDRERKLWEVIRRGARGSQYCREVDNAGIAPPRKGIWEREGGPRTYEGAYMSNERLRQWIQDEKSKTQRKAQLAGLDS